MNEIGFKINKEAYYINLNKDKKVLSLKRDTVIDINDKICFKNGDIIEKAYVSANKEYLMLCMILANEKINYEMNM